MATVLARRFIETPRQYSLSDFGGELRRLEPGERAALRS